MGTFGKRSSERTGGTGDIFLKTFGDGRTLVWPLWGDPDDFIEFKQHYDHKAKRSWPCALHEGAAQCVGCEFPVEDPTDEDDFGLSVRKKSPQWAFPAIDEKGYVSLYQIGYGLWKDLKDKYEEYGQIDDAWYAIRRSGKVGGREKLTFSATKTDNKDKPEIKVNVPDEEYISNILGRRYLDAMERYGWEEDGGSSAPDPAPVTSTGDPAADALAQRQSDAAARGVAAPSGDEAQAQPDAATSPASEAGPEDTGDWDPQMNAREAGVGELKDWLSQRPASHGGPIEFSPRLSRPVLVGMVEKAQAGLPADKVTDQNEPAF